MDLIRSKSKDRLFSNQDNKITPPSLNLGTQEELIPTRQEIKIIQEETIKPRSRFSNATNITGLGRIK